MKKMIILFLALIVLLFSLSGCSNYGDKIDTLESQVQELTWEIDSMKSDFNSAFDYYQDIYSYIYEGGSYSKADKAMDKLSDILNYYYWK